jgi:hypothetical protein
MCDQAVLTGTGSSWRGCGRGCGRGFGRALRRTLRRARARRQHGRSSGHTRRRGHQAARIKVTSTHAYVTKRVSDYAEVDDRSDRDSHAPAEQQVGPTHPWPPHCP